MLDFDALADQNVSALLVVTDPFFMVRSEEIVALVTQRGLPAVYPFREFAAAGGSMIYGTSVANAYRQAGIYSGGFLQALRSAGAQSDDLRTGNNSCQEIARRRQYLAIT